MPTQESRAQGRNSVSLVGRVSSAPVERELPSGDRLVSFRLVMSREQTAMTAKSRQVSDWVDCVAWSGRAQRSVRSWQVDDRVAVEGALRRRFFRSANSAATSRVEVEVLSARRVERARR
jgi:single-strand DNA-binding protein